MHSQANEKASAIRQLIYLADDQMWTTTPYLFATNCPWTVEDMAKRAQSIPGAGRISVSYSEFAGLLRKSGFTCELVTRYPQSPEYGQVPEGYEVVTGPQGNY